MNRIIFIDAARGFAILLVVVGHAIAVPEEQGFQSPEVLLGFWEFFQPFRMPMLLFLSGVLLPLSLKKSPKVFFAGKLRYILWPYVIWVLIRYVPNAGHVSVVDPDVWFAAGYLWFLFFLLGYYLIAFALRSLPYWQVAAGCYIIAFFLDGLAEKFSLHAVYFFLGAAVVSLSPQLSFLKSVWVRIFSGAVALLTGCFSVASGGSDVPKLAVPAVFCCIVATLACFQWLEGRTEMRFLRWMGQNSIVFYTSHFPAVSLTIVALSVAGATPATHVWIMGAAVAMVVGVLMAFFRRNPFVRVLLEAPRWPKKITDMFGAK